MNEYCWDVRGDKITNLLVSVADVACCSRGKGPWRPLISQRSWFSCAVLNAYHASLIHLSNTSWFSFLHKNRPSFHPQQTLLYRRAVQSIEPVLLIPPSASSALGVDHRHRRSLHWLLGRKLRLAPPEWRPKPPPPPPWQATPTCSK